MMGSQGLVELIKSKKLLDEGNLLIEKYINDEIMAKYVHRPIGSYETVIELKLPVGSSFTPPNVSEFLCDSDYLNLFERIQNRKDFEIVDKFLREEIRSKEDVSKIKSFLEKLPNISNIKDYLYYDYKKTLEKILSINKLPTHQEVLDLIVFSEENYWLEKYHERDFGPLNVVLFDLKSVMTPLPFEGIIFREYLDGMGLMDKGIYHILTQEFVKSLADEIKKLKVKGSMIEIAAGNGKLSYWLNKYGIPIIPTDLSPKSDFVEKIEGQKTLEKYNPEFVLTSWLEPNIRNEEEGLQRKIIEKESVKFYVSIECVHDFRTEYDNSGYWSKRFENFEVNELPNVQKYSIPINLLTERYEQYRVSPKEIIEEFKSNSEQYITRAKNVFLWKLKK